MSVTRHRAIDEFRRLSVRPEGSSVELNEALNTVHPYPLEEVVDVRRRRELVRSARLPSPRPSAGRSNWLTSAG